MKQASIFCTCFLPSVNCTHQNPWKLFTKQKKNKKIHGRCYEKEEQGMNVSASRSNYAALTTYGTDMSYLIMFSYAWNIYSSCL